MGRLLQQVKGYMIGSTSLEIHYCFTVGEIFVDCTPLRRRRRGHLT